ncbi:hypothetical protein KSP39_PZI011473 [Platanthera zijinensis]|uniref:DDE Tnp4 domain-containing protein n=1 Tax=Platanthera zijinensis TaxID=2320716 RepID=A0AAP0BGU8_9ASPA
MDFEEDEIHFNNIFAAATCAIYMYHKKYIWKAPSMPAKETGVMWVLNVLNGEPSRCLEAFKMPKEVFIDLLGELGSKYGLRGSRSTSTKEVLAMTLSVLGCNESNRMVCKRFQHSGETVSRYFNEGLMALVRMSMDIITPIDRDFRDVPSEIARNNMFMPYFKDCIGVIDSTHVKARVPLNDKIIYTEKTECLTQKVFAVCDFNMCFTFVVTGCEGTTQDGVILKQVMREPSYHFPVPLPGKYYLMNSPSPWRRGFLRPYKESMILPDFSPFCGFSHDHQQAFNQRYYALHSVIKRAFQIWKKKWIVLHDMSNFSFEKQRLIVAATMTLHNFIRKHPSQSDPDFQECEGNLVFVPSKTQKIQLVDIASIGQPLQNNGYDEYGDCGEDLNPDEYEGDDSMSMTQLRDHISHELAASSECI